MRRWLIGFFRSLYLFIDHPVRVFWFCVGFASLNLIFDGSLLQLWTLYRDEAQIHQDIDQLQKRTETLKRNIKLAQEPSFIEREARERFDLVGEKDLVFVFAEEEEFAR